MGGTDDSSNLIELSVIEHAQAHLTLYEKYGKMEDLYAYKALSNQMDEERQRAKSILGGKKSSNSHVVKSEEWRRKIGASVSATKKGRPLTKEQYASQKRNSVLGNLKRWGRRDILSPKGPKIGFIL